MVPKLRETILHGTRRDAQLEPCIVPKGTNFSTTSRVSLSYHIAKKHSAPKPAVTFKCKRCYQEFPGSYALRQQKNTQYAFLIKETVVDRDDFIHKVDDTNLKEKLRSFQHFLVNSELERATHKVFNYAVENLNETIVNEELDHFFNNLNCAVISNLVFGFNLDNVEDGGFRYFTHTKKNSAGPIETGVLQG